MAGSLWYHHNASNILTAGRLKLRAGGVQLPALWLGVFRCCRSFSSTKGPACTHVREPAHPRRFTFRHQCHDPFVQPLPTLSQPQAASVLA